MRAYKVVDVFADVPFKGNPVAVVLDAEGLADAEMQAIARWTNLSETTFLLPPADPAADYRLRIFTPRVELPFAGHPTLGSAYAALEAGRIKARDGRVVQQCGAGLVPIMVEGEGASKQLAFELPPATVRSLDAADIDELEAIIGASVVRDPPPAIVDVGPSWVVAQLASAEALLAVRPDYGRSARLEQRLGAIGVTLFGRHDAGEAEIEVRSFAPSSGVDEDPVCGSGNGSVAVYRRLGGLLPPSGMRYVAAQGRMTGRDGRVYVALDAGGRVTIGGACVTCVEGKLRT